MDVTPLDVAQPGQPEVDFDCEGTLIGAVVTEGREILVSFRGGAWHTAAMPDGILTEGDMIVVLNDADPDAFDAYVKVLERWRDRATPLRITCAPGKLSRLGEGDDNWLPVPRRWPPE